MYMSDLATGKMLDWSKGTDRIYFVYEKSLESKN